MSNQIEVFSGNKMVNIAAIPAARDYVASKLGLTLPESTKEAPVTKKLVKELALKAGKTDEQVNALYKQHDANRRQHYADSAMFIGALAADGRVRKSVRASVSKKTGEVIGYSATFRKERSVSASKDAQIAQLTAQVAKLLALNVPAAA